MAPNNNITNIDPLLINPDGLDFRLEEGSPAKGYGCETYYIAKDKEIKVSKTYTNVLQGNKINLEGNITENTLIKADTVSVSSDLIIYNSTTLKISAGTVFSFTGPYKINVEGTLIAEGTAYERIIFTSENPDPVDNYTDIKYSWAGLVFDKTLSTNDSSSIKYAVFEYAKKISYDEWDISGYYGGAIFINNFSKLIIENNIFRYNTALYGAAIGVANCQPQINNNLFYQNYAQHNGPVACFINSYSYFYNNTAIDNYIYETSGIYTQGAVFNFRSKPYFVNNIIRNSPEGITPQVHSNKEYFTYNNDIQGIYGYNNNIDADPSFDETQFIPGGLSESSVCIDSGAEIELFQPQFDLFGNPRIMNEIIDMGAFEDQRSHLIPKNIKTEIIGNYLELTWDPVIGATSYKIYASEDPYGIFEDVLDVGTYDGESWRIAYSQSRRFYYVVAVTDIKK
ncbi:MAG: right-handed parallel beta-helix repeat-containing protein [Candidatus Delongbacteria bacterium]|nr:right-handed parallel beta-helix repeat-containing protein [Candidatus Delongbacteria bacterium]